MSIPIEGLWHQNFENKRELVSLDGHKKPHTHPSSCEMRKKKAVYLGLGLK